MQSEAPTENSPEDTAQPASRGTARAWHRSPAVAVAIAYFLILGSFGAGFSFVSRGHLRSMGADVEETRNDIRRRLEDGDRARHLLEIGRKNLGAAVGLILLGAATAGLWSAVNLVVIGLVNGALAGALSAGGVPDSFLLAYFATHGLVEALAFALAGAVGLHSGALFLRYLRGGALLAPGDLRSLAWTAGLTFPALSVALLLEVYATPAISLRYLP